jgi:HAD superfamily hydrolase (TIGR01509 family)
MVDGVYGELKKNNITVDLALLKLLQELSEHSVPLAITTSGIQQGAKNKLHILGIKELFQILITADDVKHHKPHPEAYLTTMNRLGAASSKSIVFEDSIAGIKAGLAAGATVIGVTKYSAVKEPLSGAILTIDSWDEITYERLTRLI